MGDINFFQHVPSKLLFSPYTVKLRLILLYWGKDTKHGKTKLKMTTIFQRTTIRLWHKLRTLLNE